MNSFVKRCAERVVELSTATLVLTVVCGPISIVLNYLQNRNSEARSDWDTLQDAYGQAKYDEVILRSNDALLASPRQLYMNFTRAQAETSLGWYDEAQTDFQKCEYFEPLKESTRQSLVVVRSLLAARPPRYEEVKRGDDVMFRVYSDSDSALKRQVVAALTEAHDYNAQVMGFSVHSLPVYIFDTPDHMHAFNHARRIPETVSWAFADGGVDGLKFYNNSDDSTFLRSAVAHELNHALLQRCVQKADSSVPRWFTEGLAKAVGNDMVGGGQVKNATVIARLVAAQALVAPQHLENDAEFDQLTATSIADRDTVPASVQASPYDQSEHMVRFLLAKMQPNQLPHFLGQVRDLKSFDAALQVELGFSTAQFYSEWQNSLSVPVAFANPPVAGGPDAPMTTAASAFR